jgi:predicted N-acetyltransferase YhbS
MNSLVYRKIQKADYPAIQDIFCRAFKFEKGDISPRVLRIYLSFFLHMYLRLYQYGLAAELDGQVAGFLLGCFHRPVNPFYHWKDRLIYRWNEFRLLFSREGRRRVAINRGVERIDRRLMRGKEGRFDGELLLFAVREDLRRFGIGSELTRRFFDHLRNSGKRSLSLYTDGVCNVDYYRRNGYHLEGELLLRVPVRPVFQSTFYLFSKILNKGGTA